MRAFFNTDSETMFYTCVGNDGIIIDNNQARRLQAIPWHNYFILKEDVMEKIIVCIALFVVGNVGYYIKAVIYGNEGKELKHGMIVANCIIVAFVVLYLTGVIWH